MNEFNAREDLNPSQKPLTSSEAGAPLPTDVERQLKMYRLQQKGLLVLAGMVLGFFGRGLLSHDNSNSNNESYNQGSAQVAEAQPAQAGPQPGNQPPAPPTVDPKIALARLQKEALTSTIGNKNAKTTIFEFTDFQCPACQGAAQQFLPQLKDQFVKTGKAKIVLVHWPLTGIHPSATMGAKAALCAEKQGKFERFHDALFNEQQKWSSLERSESAQATVKQNLIKMAQEQGLNEGSFTSCLNSNQFDAGLARNGQLAFDLGAPGTPTFFVDGKRIQSPQEIVTILQSK